MRYFVQSFGEILFGKKSLEVRKMRKKIVNALLAEGRALARNQRMLYKTSRKPSGRKSLASTSSAVTRRCTAVGAALFFLMKRQKEARSALIRQDIRAVERSTEIKL